MTTLEPLTEAELNELQAQWMAGNRRERRAYRREEPLAEDWTLQQPPFPARWFDDGAEQEEADGKYMRHTVDITRRPMSVEDEPIAYVAPWKWLIALAVVTVFYGACWLVGRWWVQK